MEALRGVLILMMILFQTLKKRRHRPSPPPPEVIEAIRQAHHPTTNSRSRRVAMMMRCLKIILLEDLFMKGDLMVSLFLWLERFSEKISILDEGFLREGS
jgi:hypothetical protein